MFRKRYLNILYNLIITNLVMLVMFHVETFSMIDLSHTYPF